MLTKWKGTINKELQNLYENNIMKIVENKTKQNKTKQNKTKTKTKLKNKTK